MNDDFEVAIIGAGFSGIAMAVRLLRDGVSDFVVLERGPEVGGTWRDNTYPGCACDVPSHLYSFSFAPNPDWSSTFSPQPEIQAYLRRVARDHGVLAHVRLNCEVKEAAWDDEAQRWRIETSAGRMSARVLVAAPGPLSEPDLPDLPGLKTFKGTVFHSARWDHDHDLSGERVAVVGTGASAIQFVPEIQPRVRKLHVFQRTAPWVIPRRVRQLSDLEHNLYRRAPMAQRAMRAAIYWAREMLAIPLLRAGLAPVTRRLGESYLRTQVADPALRARLTPRYAPGCKRILISNDYLPALSQPNVEVITEGVTAVREHSVVTSGGEERTVDTIIFGTGFHVSDLPIAAKLRGRDGRSIEEASGGSIQAYRGTTVSGFPNLFLLLGPNTGLGHTSVVVMAESQAGYVARALGHMRRNNLAVLEVEASAQERWNAKVQKRLRSTVWNAGGCKSWYIDRLGVNTTIWPGFTFAFRWLMRGFDAESYISTPSTPSATSAAPAAPAAPTRSITAGNA